jgi:ABC-type lipoprotein release transport system permease subunit
MKAQNSPAILIGLVLIIIGISVFFVIQNVMNGAGQKSEQKAKEIQFPKISIESASGKEIVVRNIGQSKILLSNVTLYIGSDAAECAWSQWVMQPGENALCSLSFACSGRLVTEKNAQMPLECK